MRTSCAVVLGLAALVDAGVVDAQEEKRAEGEDARMPLFEALDKDGDGKISRDEALTLLDRLDADGFVIREEMRQAAGRAREGHGGSREPDGDRPAGKYRDRDEPQDHPEGKGADKPSRGTVAAVSLTPSDRERSLPARPAQPLTPTRSPRG